MARNLLFNIFGTDRTGSAAFDRFAKHVDRANASVNRVNRSMRDQDNTARHAMGGVAALAGEITGFGHATTVASGRASMFARGLAAVNLATGVLEPAVAGLIAGVMGVASATAIAGAGLGAMALAAAPAFKNVAQVQKAREKADTTATAAQNTYQAAVEAANARYREELRRSTTAAQRQAAEQRRDSAIATAHAAKVRQLAQAQGNYKSALRQLPPAQRELARAFDQAETTYKRWANSLSRPVLRPFTAALRLTGPVLRALTPLAREAAGAVGTLVSRLGGAIRRGGLQRWVEQILPHVRPMIVNLGMAIGHVVSGMGSIIVAFAPIAERVVSGIEGMTRRFRVWASTLTQHTGYRSLMRMVREQTPLALQVIKNLAEAAKNVGRAMAGLATPANSKALLQLLRPLTRMMVVLSRNQGLMQTLLYLGLIRSVLKRVSPAVMGFAASFRALGGARDTLRLVRAGFLSTEAAASKATGAAGTFGGVLRWLVTPTGAFVAAMGAAAIVTAVIIRRQRQAGLAVSDWIAKQRQQDKATAYNIAGYQKYIGQLNQAVNTTGRLVNKEHQHAASSRAAQAQVLVASRSHEILTTEYRRQVRELNATTTAMSGLQQRYRLTRDQAVRLASAAGVTYSTWAKGGKTVRDAYHKIDRYARSLDAATGMTNLQRIKTDRLTDSLARLEDQLSGNQESELDWRDALKRAQDQLRGNNRTLNINTQRGRDNRRAILDAVNAALRFAGQQLKTKNGIRDASRTIRDQIDWLHKYGGKSRWVRDLVEKLRGKLAQFRKQLQELNQIRAIRERLIVTGTGRWQSVAKGGMLPGQPGMHFVGRFARGGRIPGFGGGDSRVILAEPGETVVDKARSRRYADVLAAMGVPGYARGGLVGLPRWTQGISGRARLTAGGRALRGLAMILNRLVQGYLGPAGGGGPVSGDAAAAMRYAMGLLAHGIYGWNMGQWSAWRALGMGESGWNRFAYNAGSGAFGIPQALPYTKMPKAAWPTWAGGRAAMGPQVNWMAGYMHSVYGSPGAAYARWLSRSPHWYKAGAWKVPRTGPAVVHRGEMILPSGFAEAVREAVGGGPGTDRRLDEVIRLLARLIDGTERTGPANTAAGLRAALDGVAKRAAYRAAWG